VTVERGRYDKVSPELFCFLNSVFNASEVKKFLLKSNSKPWQLNVLITVFKVKCHMGGGLKKCHGLLHLHIFVYWQEHEIFHINCRKTNVNEYELKHNKLLASPNKCSKFYVESIQPMTVVCLNLNKGFIILLAYRN